jgi:hypothetical protein
VSTRLASERINIKGLIKRSRPTRLTRLTYMLEHLGQIGCGIRLRIREWGAASKKARERYP